MMASRRRREAPKQSRSLNIVRKYFKNVDEVVDSKESLSVEVTPRDVSTSERRAHVGCAMAVACKRAKHLDGVIISTSIAYLIKDNKATRYQVPERISREVVSF